MNTANRANWPFPVVGQPPAATSCSVCADPRPDCMGAVAPGIGDKCAALEETSLETTESEAREVAPGVFDIPGLES